MVGKRYIAAQTMRAFIPGVEGLKAIERHSLRGDAVLRDLVGPPRAAVHAEVPGRQADLIIRVGLHLRPVLKVRIIAEGTEVLAAVVVMVLDDLRLLLGDVARFRASFPPQPLLRRECLPAFLALSLRIVGQWEGGWVGGWVGL